MLQLSWEAQGFTEKAVLVRTGLTPSLEDYLEAIRLISREKPAVRAKDISARLEVTSSSVTGALRALAERDLVNYAPYDLITLTPQGSRVAGQIIHRHDVLRDFLIEVMGADEVEAEQNACRMEHSVSPAVLRRFVMFARFLEEAPAGGRRWVEAFKRYCEDGHIKDTEVHSSHHE